MKVARSAPVIGVIGQLQNVAEKKNKSSQSSHCSQVANKEPEPDVVFILIFLLILWIQKAKSQREKKVNTGKGQRTPPKSNQLSRAWNFCGMER